MGQRSETLLTGTAWVLMAMGLAGIVAWIGFKVGGSSPSLWLLVLAALAAGRGGSKVLSTRGRQAAVTPLQWQALIIALAAAAVAIYGLALALAVVGGGSAGDRIAGLGIIFFAGVMLFGLAKGAEMIMDRPESAAARPSEK